MSQGSDGGVCEFEPLILVTRGDELPKKNYERRLHPTYETSIRIKNGGQQTSPHYVVKFYDQYRDLCEALKLLGVGEGLAISIDATFPLKYPKSFVGLTLTEQQLQHRCYLLNKWMGAIFANYHRFPTKAQILISEFLSLNDDDAEEEKNKELILALLRRKKESLIAEGIISHTKTGTTLPVGIADVPTPAPRLTPEALSQLPQQQQQIGTPVGQPPTDPAVVMEKYETVIGGFLAVKVVRGGELVRKKDDTKMHHSYETQVRLLPLSEVQSTAKADIDPQTYDEQVQKTKLRVVEAFDYYRELRNDLERVHVYSSDNPTDSSAARQNGYKVIVIDAPFPPTLKKSSLGVALTEAQVQQRAEMINSWLGILLRNFNVLPRDGKELITDFLGLPSVYAQSTGSSTSSNEHFAIIHHILRGTYTPPLLAPKHGSPSHGPKKTIISYFTRKTPASTNNTVGDAAAAEGAQQPQTMTNSGTSHNHKDTGTIGAVAPTSSSTAVVMTTNDTFNISPTPPTARPASTPAGGTGLSDNESVLSGGDAMTDAGIEAVSSEIMVGQYLGVSVMRGKPIVKKIGERKTHPSYEVLLRILPLEETLLPEADKRSIDELAFNVHVEAGPMRIAFAFDAYRNLKTDLESHRVYSLEKKSEVDAMLARNPNDPVVCIDARFPRTYKRTSLGMALNDAQLNQRSVMLNQWFGALMQAFNRLPLPAQQRVLLFLTTTEPSSEAEGTGLNTTKHPRDVVILAMLKQTYTPEYKKTSPTIFGNSQDPQTGGDTGNGKKKKGKRGKGKQGMDDDGYVQDGGCACIVM